MLTDHRARSLATIALRCGGGGRGAGGPVATTPPDAGLSSSSC